MQEKDTETSHEEEQKMGGKQFMGGDSKEAEEPGKEEQQAERQMWQPPYGQPFMPPYGYYYPYMMPPVPYPPYAGFAPYPPQHAPQYGFQPVQPQYAPQPHPAPEHEHEEHRCGHHQEEDPFGGIFGMFGEMINSNPQLSAVGKMVDSTGSDFLKGLVIGAGAAMLLSSEPVRKALTDMLGSTIGSFTEETEENI